MKFLGIGFDPLADWFGLERSGFALNFPLGPWQIAIEGRAVFFLLVSALLIAVAAIPSFSQRNRN